MEDTIITSLFDKYMESKYLDRTFGPHICRYKVFCLLGYIAVYPAENQPTFRRNM